MKIAVVGAGIVGASAAYHLAKWGHETTIIEDRAPGQATEHAAGIICPWLSKRRNKIWYELAKHSAAFYPQLSRELAGFSVDSGYKQVGTLALRGNEMALDALFALAKERRVSAPEMGEVIRLQEADVKKRFPLVQPGFGAVFVSGGGRVNGARIRDALLDGAKRNGAVKMEAHGKVNAAGALFAGEEEVAFDKIVLAAGAWMPRFLEPLGFEADVLAQKGQIVTMTFAEKTDDWPVILPPAAKSIVPFDAGQIMLGATHEKEAGFDREPTEAGYEEIIRELAPFIQLKGAQTSTISVGTRPYTPDFTPFIGQIGDTPIYAANGLGASGLTTGPFVGKLIAECALGEPVSLDITRFDPANYIRKR
ncbi:FAD-binding oxidoreductase [Listeria sp. ILCC792]|uniref:NAD(P)/FAD-dependent oxidoreductase n=1 Tax=Listeria sp. ILCC792 TaxID=1918331 RepID=UPI000B58D990|nr:FAD-dependent oxidoreductase [Listeria sp. ILCC792]